MRTLESHITFVAVILLVLLPYSWAARESIDLQPELCELAAQQPNNDPMAGVSFLSNNQLVVYTICHSPGKLSTREEFRSTDPNHLKAVILNLPAGSVGQRFDWPTRGRRSQVRVTHSGDLLVLRDNLIQTLTPNGQLISALQLVKAGVADSFFLNFSPAINPITVIQSSDLPTEGKAENAIAVLDSPHLETIAQWHDDRQSWRTAASREIAVRLYERDSLLQFRSLPDIGSNESKWQTVPKVPSNGHQALFVSESEFAVVGINSIRMFKSAGSEGDPLPCGPSTVAMGAVVSRDGSYVGIDCARLLGGSSVLKADVPLDAFILVFQMSLPRRVLANVPIETSLNSGFDFAISPDGLKIAIVDHLRLTLVDMERKTRNPVSFEP